MQAWSRLADSRGKWWQLRQLSAAQWRALMGFPFIMCLTWFRLHTTGYRAALSRTIPKNNSQQPREEQLKRARHLAYALAVAVKYGPWRPQCLLRSLCLGWFLARQGIPSDLRMGVPLGNSVIRDSTKLDFSAHAWVEFDGVVLNDKQDIASQFSAFEPGS
jgi:hypothetical protein